MDLGGGGAKPPSYNAVTQSPRGINLFTIVDDIQYAKINAYPIKKNGDSDSKIYTSLGKIVETDSAYLAFFTSEKKQSFELSDLNIIQDIGFVSVSKDLSSSSDPVWLTSLESESAQNLIPVKINSETIIVLFEIWSEGEYSQTAFLLLDSKGK